MLSQKMATIMVGQQAHDRHPPDRNMREALQATEQFDRDVIKLPDTKGSLHDPLETPSLGTEQNQGTSGTIFGGAGDDTETKNALGILLQQLAQRNPGQPSQASTTGLDHGHPIVASENAQPLPPPSLLDDPAYSMPPPSMRPQPTPLTNALDLATRPASQTANYDGTNMPSADISTTDADLLASISGSLPFPELENLPLNQANLASHAAFFKNAANHPSPQADRGQIEAFAKLEFPDGNYYITTHACELGRDVRAYQAALARAADSRSSRHDEEDGSRGKASHRSDKHRKSAGSQVKGSIISDRAGFLAMDDAAAIKEEETQIEIAKASHSSQLSESPVVKPEEVERRAPLPLFDYFTNAQEQAEFERDDEVPAPVTSEHLPNADETPLIPIHATSKDGPKSEIENHKSISRRHVRISWDFEKDAFKMKVFGRNGAFLDNVFLPYNTWDYLHHGSVIQIAGIPITFKLPNADAEESMESEDDEARSQGVGRTSTTPTSDNTAKSTSPARDERKKKGANVKAVKRREESKPEIPAIPDPLTMPPKKRGPGRPPKDGVMSKRERREIEKANKQAAQKQANNGITPPPSGRGKYGRPSNAIASPVEVQKSEKRKYTKRKRADGEPDGDVLPSIEGGEVEVDSADEKSTKNKRPKMSPSPDYPAKETLTEEQLRKPDEHHSQVLYDILMENYPKSLNLRRLYRAVKLKFPYYVHCTNTDGWQSSVRHNLNQLTNLFTKAEKEGKGYNWKAIPGAMESKEKRDEKKKAAQPAPAPPQPSNQSGGVSFAQNPQMGKQWQQGSPFPTPQHPLPNNIPPQSNSAMLPPPNSAGGPFNPPPHGQNFGSPMPNGGGGRPGLQNQQGLPFPPKANAKQFNRPPSQTQLQHPQQAPPNWAPPHQSPQGMSRPPSGIAAPNMPCTFTGVTVLDIFQNTYLNDNPDPIKREQSEMIFKSVRRRALHGAPESTVSGGESAEEQAILGEFRKIIDMHRNEGFKGFSGANRA